MCFLDSEGMKGTETHILRKYGEGEHCLGSVC